MLIYQGLEQPRIRSMESHDGLLQIADHQAVHSPALPVLVAHRDATEAAVMP